MAAKGEPCPELTVVMPVYNEAGLVARVVALWAAELDRLGIDYVLAMYDDGSRDGTLEALQGLASSHPRLQIRSHPNVGHGPTILRGYREASGAWVLQVDGDHEIWPDDFEPLWNSRHDHDFIVGRRVHRHSPFARRLVSWAARMSVRALFGARVHDVNVPYRLIRRDALQRMLTRIPPQAFAPNVIMSGLAARDGLRTAEHVVRHHDRSAGRTSLSSARALRRGWRCLRETARAALRRRS